MSTRKREVKSIRARKVKGEGWDVFNSSGSADGTMQICRIDDPGCCIPDTDPRLKARPDADVWPAFAGDHQAIKHVIARAKKGDEDAIDALWLCLDHDGLLNRILWCEAMGWRGRRDAAYPDQFAETWYEKTGYWEA